MLTPDTTSEEKGRWSRIGGSPERGARALVRAVGLIVAGAFSLSGCGGDSGPALPSHSPSFFPVRATVAAGGPAKLLEWIYRINSAQAVAYSVTPGSTIRYADERVTVTDGAVLTRSVEGLLSSSSGGPSGRISSTSTDHLTDDSPANIVERDVDSSATLTVSGAPRSSHVAIMYGFAATPMATFFDRDDLDALALGFSETQQATGTATGSVTATGSSGPQTEQISVTVIVSQSWTLREQLPTFEVLGRAYQDVARVESVTSVVESTTGTTDQTTSNTWLAKGIGVIRSEDVLMQSSGTDTTVSELIDTNLVAP